ncbi:MAG: hypothetical protein KatS3mg096_769 [Candidatus Parcubacteria bacterium]|nr:MAG: hypothetical protein KatS3mg096_769 [Candidatus Parcubacteria bacterium]
MAQVKIQYGTTTDITPSGLNGLANNAYVDTAAQSNTTALAIDYLISINVNGTAASTARVDVYLLCSQDGTNFDTQESAKQGSSIILSASPQQRTYSLTSDFNLDSVPQNFKIRVVNKTGAALGASGNTIKITPIYRQIV